MLRRSRIRQDFSRRDALKGLGALLAAGAIPRARAILPLGGSSSGGAFFTDPFTGYTNYWVDGVNGNDSNSGTTQLSPKKTIPAAIALITSAASVVRVLNTGVYAPTTNITMPAISGTSPTAQIAIAGLPSYTSAQLPQIVFGPNAGFYLNVNSNAVNNPAFWKLDISSSSSVSNQAQVGLIQFLSQSVVTGLSISFCRLHDIYGTDLTACLHAEGAGSTATVANSYLYNVTTSDGSSSDNGACILEYQVAVRVMNCDFTGAPCLIYYKRCPPTGNGPIVTNSFFHNYTNDGIYYGEQGAGDSSGFLNCSVTGCLFLSGFQGLRQDNRENLVQSTGFIAANNTFADMNNCIAFAGMTNADLHSNIMIASGDFLELQSPTPLANSLARCDYNSYQTTPQSWDMDEFGGGGAQNFTSLASWQTAFSVSARPELSANPDTHATSFTPGSVATNFPNGTTTGNNWGLASGSALRGTGLSGVDPGYNQAACGPGW
jgi:hypothetical protein